MTRTFDSACVSGENGFFPRAGVTQLVECDLAKVDVAGSNPVSRSSPFPAMMKHYLLLFFAALTASAQEYKLEPIAAAAPDLPAAYTAEIAAQGYRVVGPAG